MGAHAKLDAIRTIAVTNGQGVLRPVEAQIFNAELADHTALEAELPEIFESPQTTPTGKQYACRMLRYCASEACVSVLAPELTNPELSQFVRRVSQSLESPAAEEALVAALPTVGIEYILHGINTRNDRRQRYRDTGCFLLMKG